MVNKNKSLSRNHKKSSKKSNTKQKAILSYDVHTIQTIRTQETVEKKPRKYSHTKTKTNCKKEKERDCRENKKQKNKEKMALDSLKNKKPLKLSKSGRFQSEYNVKMIQPIDTFTQNTVNDHEQDE